MITERVSSNSTRAEITKCIPNAKHYVRILAYDNSSDGTPSQLISFETPEGGKPIFIKYNVILSCIQYQKVPCRLLNKIRYTSI